MYLYISLNSWWLCHTHNDAEWVLDLDSRLNDSHDYVMTRARSSKKETRELEDRRPHFLMQVILISSPERKLLGIW